MQSALSDIFGKLAGLPVYRLLGGETRDRVLVYAHIYGKDVDETVSAARRAISQGYRVLRMSPPEVEVFEATKIARESVKQFAAVREAVGDDIEIAFDAHTRFTPRQGIELCELLAPYRPYFVEDPIRAEDMSLYRQIRSQTKIPLAAGEQLNHLWDFRELIENNLADYLRVDLSHCGGISQARKIAAMAEAHHQELVTHHTASPLNTAANFQFNMATPNCVVQEFATPSPEMPEITPNALTARNGFLVPNDLPGLGLEFNEATALAAERRLKDRPHRHLRNLRRPDGSVNNW